MIEGSWVAISLLLEGCSIRNTSLLAKTADRNHRFSPGLVSASGTSPFLLVSQLAASGRQHRDCTGFEAGGSHALVVPLLVYTVIVKLAPLLPLLFVFCEVNKISGSRTVSQLFSCY